MDVTRRDGKAMKDFDQIMLDLKYRTGYHSAPAIARGHHGELGWVVLVKDGHNAVLISERAFADFIEEG